MAARHVRRRQGTHDSGSQHDVSQGTAHEASPPGRERSPLAHGINAAEARIDGLEAPIGRAAPEASSPGGAARPADAQPEPRWNHSSAPTSVSRTDANLALCDAADGLVLRYPSAAAFVTALARTERDSLPVLYPVRVMKMDRATCLQTARSGPVCVAHLARLLGISRLGLLAQRVFHYPYVRAVNYHSTPQRYAANLEKQVQWLSRHFVSCGPCELASLLEHRWPHARPGIVLTFDDGLANNAEVAAPLLEQHGLCGWFCIPPGFIDCPSAQLQSFAQEQRISSPGQPMSWEQIRRLSQQHVIVSHGQTHRRLTSELTPDELHYEVVVSKNRIEERIGRRCEAFCWVGGEKWAYSSGAARMIASAGYRYAFMTNSAPIRPCTHPLQLQRTNVEASWPLALLQLQISGLQDLRYTRKRCGVVRTTWTGHGRLP